MAMPTRHAIYFALLIAVLGGTAIFGLREITKNSGQGVTVEAVVYPLKLVMSLNKTTYMLGETVTINLQLINISNSTVTLWFVTCALPGGWLRFNVYHASKGDLGSACSFYEPQAPMEVTLDPGSFLGQTWEWDQKVGIPTMGIDFHSVGAGNYNIIGFLEDLNTLNGSYIKMNLETPPIQISIG